jgi:Flp pilus assembly protein TadD
MSETYNLFQQGRAHLREGMAAQATVPLEKAKRREPEKASIREALGIAYFRIHRYAEAESEFRKLLELAPVDDYGHYALGRCLEKQGRQTEAQGHYKLASSLRPASKDYSSRIRDVA